MLEINKTKEELVIEINTFMWEFKIGDNILYNLDILYKLIEDCNSGSSKIYHKPISIITVSIIEAIMIDFLYRLYQGTSHFPSSLTDKYSEIKSKLRSETIEVSSINGDTCVKLKSFNFTPMIRLYKRFDLFGDGDDIYHNLRNLAYFRNRIHIQNYFNNFERDENVTFSKERVQKTLDTMIWVIEYFKDNYKRPW